ncbi:hypothetical protein [Megalodesulfovibrio paquesii]
MLRFMQTLKSLFGAAGKAQSQASGRARQSLHDDLEDAYAAVAFAERGEHVVAERDILGALQRDTRRTRQNLGALLQDVGLTSSHVWYGHVVV